MKFIRDIIAEKTQQSERSNLESQPDAIGHDDIQLEPHETSAAPETDLRDIMRGSLAPPSQALEDDEPEDVLESDTAFDVLEFDEVDDPDEQIIPADTAEDDGEFIADADVGAAFQDAEHAEEDISMTAVDPFETTNEAEDSGFSLSSDTFIATSSFQISASANDLAFEEEETGENLFSEPSDAPEIDDVTTPEEVLEHAVEALNEEISFEEQAVASVPDAPFGAAPMPRQAPVQSDMREEVRDPEPAVRPAVQAIPPQPVDVPAPAVGRGAARAGRVKTRLLGFNAGHGASPDPFQKTPQDASVPQEASKSVTHFPVGWLVISSGPGRGAAFTLFNGVSQIGRGKDQTVCLDFGDNSISRESHAAIAYDVESKKFYLGHGGKTNLVRLNNRPVLSTEEMQSGNQIRVGETTLHFVALCGEGFQWEEDQQENFKNAAYS